MDDKVIAVNELLEAGEPGNISVDNHAGGRVYTGYKPQAIIDAMNEYFWGQWGFEEVGNEILEDGKLVVAQVRVFLQGIEFQPSGWGQGRVTSGDIGDARKSAQTDALKKALSYFSIGAKAYRGELEKTKPAQIQHSQPAQKQQSKQSLSMAQLMTRALDVGWVTGKTREEHSASWRLRMREIFGQVPEGQMTSQDLALINYNLERFVIEQKQKVS